MDFNTKCCIRIYIFFLFNILSLGQFYFDGNEIVLEFACAIGNRKTHAMIRMGFYNDMRFEISDWISVEDNSSE